MRTNAGEFRSEHYILATGAWSNQLLPIPVTPKKGQMLCVRVPGVQFDRDANSNGSLPVRNYPCNGYYMARTLILCRDGMAGLRSGPPAKMWASLPVIRRKKCSSYSREQFAFIRNWEIIQFKKFGGGFDRQLPMSRPFSAHPTVKISL